MNSLIFTTIFYTLLNTFVYSSPAKSPYLNGRIVNGSLATPGQFPYIVSLQRNIGWDYAHTCGGSIIGSHWVLTAGHCCEDINIAADDPTVVAGTNKLNAGGVVYNVTELYIHPNYVHEPFIDLENDICILKVAPEIKESDLIQIVSLSNITDHILGDATVAGWGYLDYNIWDTPNDMQYLQTTIIPLEECIASWGNHGFYTIRSSQVCSFTQKGEGTCNGDSGSPLIVEDESGSFKQVGIVSWGDPCATGYPDIYTKVSPYTEWINSVINV